MAWLAYRHLVHLLSASGFGCTQEGSGVKVSREALGATTLN